MTHTYVILEVSAAAYEEIASKLKEAGYEHTFHEEKLVTLREAVSTSPYWDIGTLAPKHERVVRSRIVIDMHGIALAKEEALAGAGSNNVSVDRIAELEVRLENVTNPPCEFCPHRAHEHEAPGADCDQPCNKCECDVFYPREGIDWTPPSLDKKESR